MSQEQTEKCGDWPGVTQLWSGGASSLHFSNCKAVVSPSQREETWQFGRESGAKKRWQLRLGACYCDPIAGLSQVPEQDRQSGLADGEQLEEKGQSLEGGATWLSWLSLDEGDKMKFEQERGLEA